MFDSRNSLSAQVVAEQRDQDDAGPDRGKHA
jgi:hypothetical protein